VIGWRYEDGVRIVEGFDHAVDHGQLHLLVVELGLIDEAFHEQVTDIDNGIEEVVVGGAVGNGKGELNQERAGEEDEHCGSENLLESHGELL
jgi:hypothetical protein